MTLPSLRRVVVPAVVLLSTLVAPAARADDPPDSNARADARPVRIRQEWVGVEVPLGGYVTKVHSDGVIYRDPERSHASAGWGAILRFGRHHWDAWYWTPLALGAYEGKAGASLKYVAALTEPGVSVLSRGPHALDIGFGLGLGFMGMDAGGVDVRGGCDGPCQLGGGGLLLSPVVRYVFTTPAGTSAGVSLRGLIPTDSQGWFLFGYGREGTSLVLLSLDFAHGAR